MTDNLAKILQHLSQLALTLEAHKDGCDPSFKIEVRLQGYKGDKSAKIELVGRFWDNGDWQQVRGADFDTITTEMNRRLGFGDQQALEIDRLQQSLKALPPPDEAAYIGVTGSYDQTFLGPFDDLDQARDWQATHDLPDVFDYEVMVISNHNLEDRVICDADTWLAQAND
jgi:hypothetical protein